MSKTKKTIKAKGKISKSRKPTSKSKRASKEVKEKPHYLGHRERLRERFRRVGGKGLSDYELLELILFRAVPRGDVKPLAKQLLSHFGSFPAILNAERAELIRFENIGNRIVDELHLTNAAILHAMHHKTSKKPLLSSWEDMFYYCQHHIGYKSVEYFCVLFLDVKHRLISDELLNKGTINHNTVYPREIVKRAMELNAMSVVLVHNHPSGSAEPSHADIELTKEIALALKPINIKVYDHIIVARGEITSFQKLNLLRELNP